MRSFSFCQSPGKAFPEYVMDDGAKVKVDADFRTVIRCIDILLKPKIPDEKKQAMIRSLFFDGCWVSNPAWLFYEFVKEKGAAEDPGKRVMDFMQDQDAIYTSFLQQYQMDLTTIPYLHWYKFRVLLAGLGEDTELGYRVRIRNMDTRKFEGKDRVQMERLKRRFALDEAPMEEEERLLQRSLDEALQKKQDPAPYIKALKEYYERQDGGSDGS